MDDQEKENAKAKYEVERKAYVDRIRRQRLKLNVDKNTSSLATYSGCLHPVLRPMAVVEANRLRVGDTFPDINTLNLRVAEEANLRGITFTVSGCKMCIVAGGVHVPPYIVCCSRVNERSK
jgi:hypothetical protein